ncbi:MAG: hypothetical protein K8T10_16925 [Candidatus Eremiobacteraeota bacterium]|nr:hypothetical protein [Candidatus Eremiobacteraeota bacterium]
MDIQILLIYLTMFSMVVAVVGYFICNAKSKKDGQEETGKEVNVSIIEYFRSATDIARKHIWLVVLPLIFVIFGYLIQYGINVLSRSMMPAFLFTDITRGTGIINLKMLLFRICNVFSVSLTKLSYGYNGAYGASLLFVLVFIFTMIGFRAIPGKLDKYIKDENKADLRILRIVLTFALITNVVLIIMSVLSYVFKMPFLPIFAGTALFITIIVSLLIPLSLLQGYIFGATRIYVENREFSKEEPVNVAVNIFKPLFCINILLTALATWYYIIMLPPTIANFSADIYIPFPQPSPLFTFISSVMTAFLVTLPFTPLYIKGGVREMLVENYSFIKNNLASFLKLVSIGFVGMFILSFAFLLSSVFLPGTIKLVFDLFLLTIQVIFGVIFFIALMKLFVSAYSP